MSLATTTRPKSPQRRRFTREEFYQMLKLGWFEDQPAEFLDGEIIDMPPQGPPHYYCIMKAVKLLELVFAIGYWVRSQAPLSLRVNGDPNPDVAVVRGNPQDFLNAHPDHALLAVEVSESSLAYDRGQKASLYAKAGIADYWMINLPDRQLEVYRDPTPDSAQHYGFDFHAVTILKPGDFVTPLAAPQARIAIADLLP
jgi:Uma2 family endonuclease